MAMRTIRVRGDRIPILFSRAEATLFAFGNSADWRFLALREKIGDILHCLPDYLEELDEASEPEDRGEQLTVDHGMLLEPGGATPQAEQRPENRRCHKKVTRPNQPRGWCNEDATVKEIGDRGLVRWVCPRHVTPAPVIVKRSRGRPRNTQEKGER